MTRIRKKRGIHSQAEVLEALALEDTPTDVEIATPEDLRIIRERLLEVAFGNVVPAETVFKQIGYGEK
jgi:hypothetical protein